MPKHIINSRYDGQTVQKVESDGSLTAVVMVEPFLHIGWSRDGEHVEIATRDGGDYDEREIARPGFFVQLDRNGINDLIRTLRRARDAAYGADA